MIPTQDMTPYPTFGDNSSRVKPDDAKYAAGFQPGDVVPAEWFNWLLNRGSSATTKLNDGTLSMEREINNVLQAGNQVPDATLTDQLVTAISYIINQVRLDEQQRPAVGVPTLWLGSKPDWALDFGNGAGTQYLWANYPKLNNDKFKSILSTLSDAGWMTAYDAAGFYVPDLRGVVPVGYGTNGRRTGETTSGGTLGQYLASQNKRHVHGNSLSVTNSTHTGTTVVSAWKRNYGGVSGVFLQGSAAYLNNYGEANEHYGDNYQVPFSLTTGVSVGITNAYEGASGQASKPATIACMWIVRFE